MMFEKIIEKISNTNQGTKLIGPLGVIDIDKNKYTLLNAKSSRMVFCDGGNGAIFSSPNCRVEFIRLCALEYEGVNRVGIKRKEGVLLLQRKNGKIVVEGEEFNFLFTIEETDGELRVGSEIVSLERVANLCRFMLECEFLVQFSGTLVRDGPLLGRNLYEIKALMPFLSRSSLGVVKSHSVVTDSGLSAENVLSQEGIWSYPLGEKGGVRVQMVRLSKRGSHLFRVDSHEADLESLTILNDPVFLGYPYPLILADRLGRVSEKEISALKMRFMSEAKEKWRELELSMHGNDAHSILDSI